MKATSTAPQLDGGRQKPPLSAQLSLFSEDDGAQVDERTPSPSDHNSPEAATAPVVPDDHTTNDMVDEWIARAKCDDETDMMLDRIAMRLARAAVRIGVAQHD